LGRVVLDDVRQIAHGRARARSVERELVALRVAAYVLDGDNLRHGLTGDLGFTPADRTESVRRTAHVALLLADAGVISLVALVSPYAADRRIARRLHEQAGHAFLEVWVDTPLTTCERRDTKGLYARARCGEIAGLTGVDAPYEPPVAPDLRLPSLSVRAATDAVLAAARRSGILRTTDIGASCPETISRPPESALTPREREIMVLLDQGISNKEIARRLGIQLSTVKNHVHHILEKLHADRRGQAVALARGAITLSAENVAPAAGRLSSGRTGG